MHPVLQRGVRLRPRDRARLLQGGDGRGRGAGPRLLTSFYLAAGSSCATSCRVTRCRLVKAGVRLRGLVRGQRARPAGGRGRPSTWPRWNASSPSGLELAG
ncbi:hypothetical protein [Nonomuraea dietziae]|uniref:hypothetical protein n=1 Tax=Nonomuraea dietziae TaxID=65515 RepID=UPI0031DB9D78